MGLELQDAEILEIRKIQIKLNNKYSLQARSEKVIDEIEKDAVEALYHLGFVAHVDAFPILQGEQMTITLLHRADPSFEFDHERKAHDVVKAREKGEIIHGESRATD